jgi:hypothetical protein
VAQAPPAHLGRRLAAMLAWVRLGGGVRRRLDDFSELGYRHRQAHRVCRRGLEVGRKSLCAARALTELGERRNIVLDVTSSRVAGRKQGMGSQPTRRLREAWHQEQDPPSVGVEPRDPLEPPLNAKEGEDEGDWRATRHRRAALR